MSFVIKNKNKIFVFLITLVIASGLFIFFNFNSDSRALKKESSDIKQYIEDSSAISNSKEEQKTSVNSTISNKYVAVLEIPSIGLEKGLVSLDDKYNNADYNIQTIESSLMPNVANGNLILAAHSGSSSISYFKNLYKMKINDKLIIYYNGIKYTYVLSNYYDIDKTGYADIVRDKNQNTLTLITCKRGTDKQTIFISYLKNKVKY